MSQVGTQVLQGLGWKATAQGKSPTKGPKVGLGHPVLPEHHRLWGWGQLLPGPP